MQNGGMRFAHGFQIIAAGNTIILNFTLRILHSKKSADGGFLSFLCVFLSIFSCFLQSAVV